MGQETHDCRVLLDTSGPAGALALTARSAEPAERPHGDAAHSHSMRSTLAEPAAGDRAELSPGAAPARRPAATSANVEDWIASRRSAMSRARNERLWSVSRRWPVSSRPLSR